MAVKNKKTKKSTAKPRTKKTVPSFRRRIGLGILALICIATAYQVYRAQHSDNLGLEAPAGSIGREAEIDHSEIQQEQTVRDEYDERLISNAHATDETMQAALEASDVEL
jgi:hypothetical protein